MNGQYSVIRKQLAHTIKKVFDSQHFILGENVRLLEKKVAQKTGTRYAVALASGSDALYLSLLALGLGPGDEVITTPFTFFATAGSILRVGAKPVFADVEPATLNIDPVEIEKKITKKTKAIIPVHLFGLPCDMTAIGRLAKKYNLFVVEDAAQSFGALHKGRSTGSIGDVGCFSFYPTKNFGCAGDGGMAVTSSKALAIRISQLRDHGQKKKYHHIAAGINSRLDEIQAAVLLVKLPWIERWNVLRQSHAAEYNRKFEGLPLQIPRAEEGDGHIYHLYTILTSKRDSLMKVLISQGIHTGVYYPLPMHLQPCLRWLGYKKGDFPKSETASKQVLSLPMYAELDVYSRRRVAASVRKFFGEAS